MANETYTLIQKTTLNAAAASIEFTSIPQTFTDLFIMLSTRTATGGAAGANIEFNSDTTSGNYTAKQITGNGSTVASNTLVKSSVDVNGSTDTANTFANGSIYIPNYTSSNQKSFSVDSVTENNATTAYTALRANKYSGTAAITSIKFTNDSAASFAQYSSASLYGVAKQGVNPVAGPKASGGDIITNDGTYWIHQFLNSGTFTPSQTLSTEYLVVAGGGGGGANNGAGAGAGGYLTASGFSLTAGTSYTATVGAGGVGGVTQSDGTQGSNSVFSTITSTGGGYGAGYVIARGGASAQPGGNGGSSGGGSGAFSSGGGGGAGAVGTNGGTGNNSIAGVKTASPAQGNNGGAGSSGTTAGGVGGDGTSSSINGTATTRAGGGGGTGSPHGAGGSGGGGAGGGASGTNGTVNTGGGGGGSSTGGSGTTGGTGGSGIVIIRYAM